MKLAHRDSEERQARNTVVQKDEDKEQEKVEEDVDQSYTTYCSFKFIASVCL